MRWTIHVKYIMEVSVRKLKGVKYVGGGREGERGRER
jgi:hypothetical protein